MLFRRCFCSNDISLRSRTSLFVNLLVLNVCETIINYISNKYFYYKKIFYDSSAVSVNALIRCNSVICGH